MQLERVFRDAGHGGASAEAGAVPPSLRDYRQEAADCDNQLARQLNQLAELYRPTDVVNRGAQ